MKFVPGSKLPATSNLTFSRKRSFGCVVVRFTKCNFAQDDKFLENPVDIRGDHFGGIQKA